MVRAARAAGLPVAVSFTVETDGRLPSGQTLRAAIEQVDAETDGAPLHYMINCAHPTHFEGALADGGPWSERIRGLRANASTLSHAELDEAEELDDGDPADLAARTSRCAGRCPTSRSSVVAAAPTSATSRASATPGSVRYDVAALRATRRGRSCPRGEREAVRVERVGEGRELRDHDARRPVDEDPLAVHPERRVDAARAVEDPPLVVVEGVGLVPDRPPRRRGRPRSGRRRAPGRERSTPPGTTCSPERRAVLEAHQPEAREVAQRRADAALRDRRSRSGRA